MMRTWRANTTNKTKEKRKTWKRRTYSKKHLLCLWLVLVLGSLKTLVDSLLHWVLDHCQAVIGLGAPLLIRRVFVCIIWWQFSKEEDKFVFSNVSFWSPLMTSRQYSGRIFAATTRHSALGQSCKWGWGSQVLCLPLHIQLLSSPPHTLYNPRVTPDAQEPPLTVAKVVLLLMHSLPSPTNILPCSTDIPLPFSTLSTPSIHPVHGLPLNLMPLTSEHTTDDHPHSRIGLFTFISTLRIVYRGGASQTSRSIPFIAILKCRD